MAKGYLVDRSFVLLSQNSVFQHILAPLLCYSSNVYGKDSAQWPLFKFLVLLFENEVLRYNGVICIT